MFAATARSKAPAVETPSPAVEPPIKTNMAHALQQLAMFVKDQNKAVDVITAEILTLEEQTFVIDLESQNTQVCPRSIDACARARYGR